MKPSAPSMFLTVLVAMAVGAPEASAEEWLHLDPLEAELVLEYDSFWRRPRNRQGTVDFDIEEGLRIRQSGYSLDRRIATFSIEVEPTFSQGRFSGIGEDRTRKGNFLNFSSNLSLLHGTPGPFSLNINASRSSGIIDGSLGNRTRFLTSNRSVALNWKKKILPTTLRYDERVLDQSFQSGLSLNTTARNEKLRTLSLRGRNRKLNILTERQWLEDRSSITERDFTLNRARLAHNFNWGKGSRLDTRLELTDRRGSNANRRFGVNESATIQHTETVSSTTSYSFSTVEQETKTTEHRGDFRLTHRLYKNLTSIGFMRGVRRRADFQNQDEYEFGGNFGYQKAKLFGADVSAGLGGSYRVTDRRSQTGLLSIVDESHSVPVLGVVLLVERFVEIASIVVTDATGAFAFTEGSDYELVQVVDDFTEIRIIPGGQISDGDSILVSYEFASLPSQKFESVSRNYSLSLDFGWVTLSHQSSRLDQTLLAGIGSDFLTGRFNKSTNIEFKWSNDKTRASLKGERRLTQNGRFLTKTYSIKQSAFYQASRRLSLTFSAKEIFVKTGNRTTTQYRFDQSAVWVPARGWQVRPQLSGWLRKEKGSSVLDGEKIERFLVTGLNIRWNLRSIRTNLSYNHNFRSGDIQKSHEDRVLLTLRRKF